MPKDQKNGNNDLEQNVYGISPLGGNHAEGTSNADAPVRGTVTTSEIITTEEE